MINYDVSPWRRVTMSIRMFINDPYTTASREDCLVSTLKYLTTPNGVTRLQGVNTISHIKLLVNYVTKKTQYYY